MDRYMMISQDCHAGAPWFVYRKFLDPQFREEYDRWVAEYADGSSALDQSQLDKVKPFQFETMGAARQLEYMEAMEKSMGHLGNWDPTVRARELDREGIAGEVVFCDGSQKNFPPFGVGFVLRERKKGTYEQRRAGCRAHNRWLAEFCQSNKGRHAGIALITMDNPEDTVNDIRWAKQNGLFGGVLLPALQLMTDGPESFWQHPRFEPVWQVCEELDMPLNTHASSSGVIYGGSRLAGSAENAWTTFRPFWHMLWGGVFERHPGLKFCPTESGGMLALWFNAYFDQYLSVNRRPDEVKAAISLKPSDYWYRQCFIGASAHASRAEIDERYKLGVKNLMWGSDYPHPEGTWPASMQRTQELFAGIPEDEVRLMIGGNAARVYNFDLKLMNSIAAKIGPKIADISGAIPAKA